MVPELMEGWSALQQLVGNLRRWSSRNLFSRRLERLGHLRGCFVGMEFGKFLEELVDESGGCEEAVAVDGRIVVVIDTRNAPRN